MSQPQDTVTIGLIGDISVGKSTTVNSFFVNQLSSTGIHPTTMLPIMFRELNGDHGLPESIKMDVKEAIWKIQEANDRFSKRGPTTDECRQMDFFVPPIFDLLDEANKGRISLNICDVPGIDKNFDYKVYLDWLANNFDQFDIIILVLDVNKPFLQEPLFRTVLQKMKEKQSRTDMIVIVNKCDHMTYKDGKFTFIISNSEYEKILQDIAHAVNVAKHEVGLNINIPVIPASMEDSYVYRSLMVMERKRRAGKPFTPLGLDYQRKIVRKEVGTDLIMDEGTLSFHMNNIIRQTQNDEYYRSKMENNGFAIFSRELNQILHQHASEYFYPRLLVQMNTLTPMTLTQLDECMSHMKNLMFKEMEINRKHGTSYKTIMVHCMEKIKTFLHEGLEVNQLYGVNDTTEKKEDYQEYLSYWHTIVDRIICSLQESFPTPDNPTENDRDLETAIKIMRDIQLSINNRLMRVEIYHFFKQSYTLEYFLETMEKITMHASSVDFDKSYLKELSLDENLSWTQVMDVLLERSVQGWIKDGQTMKSLFANQEHVKVLMYRFPNAEPVKTLIESIFMHHLTHLTASLEDLQYLFTLQNTAHNRLQANPNLWKLYIFINAQIARLTPLFDVTKAKNVTEPREYSLVEKVCLMID